MTARASAHRAETVVELYGQGLSLRQVAARLGVSHMTVKRDLADGKRLPRERHLRVVRDRPRRRRAVRPAAVFVPPAGAAIAFTADRGWHLTEAPPGWFMDLLAELS